MPPQQLSPRKDGLDYTQPHSYFVTTVVRNRERVFADPTIAKTVIDVLLDYRRRKWFYLYAYCVMPDHLHVLLRPPRQGRHLSLIVKTIKSQTVLRSARLAQWRWQRGYYDHVVREYEDAGEFATYIRANPVRAGLVSDAMEYPFSGSPDPWY